MTLTYELLQRDFYDALVAHRNRSAWTKWFLRFMVLVLVLAIGGLVFVAILGSDVHFATNNALPLLLLGVCWSFVLWVQPWLAAKNQFGKQPSAQGPRKMSVGAAGIHWEWSGGSADIEWKNFVRLLETQKQFLLYSSPACFNIIPKRALTSDQLDSFRQLVSANLSQGSSAAERRRIDPRLWIFLSVVVFALVLLLMIIRNSR